MPLYLETFRTPRLRPQPPPTAAVPLASMQRVVTSEQIVADRDHVVKGARQREEYDHNRQRSDYALMMSLEGH